MDRSSLEFSKLCPELHDAIRNASSVRDVEDWIHKVLMETEWRTRQADIEAMCKYCKKHSETGRAPATKHEDRMYHFYTDDYFECKASHIHEMIHQEKTS
jgi:hypothetical protein